MLTPSAERLLDALRNNETVQRQFYIPAFFNRNECGTTGCIAGWCAMLDAQVDRNMKIDMKNIFEPIKPSVDEDWISASDYAEGALGLTPDQGFHLFLPWEWQEDWSDEQPVLAVRDMWTPNSTPDADTQKRLHQFARDWEGARLVTARQAAHALENVLLNHPGWVDWHRAVEAEPA